MENGIQTRSTVTRLLLDLRRGGKETDSERLHELVYDEMRKIAGHLMRRERSDHTLQPTALVHEAYLKLVDTSKIQWQSRAHFMAIAARAMRQVLVDHARQRAAAKRGGNWQKVTLQEAEALGQEGEFELLALHDALDKLATVDERAWRVAEMRIFGGMTGQEMGEVLAVSRRTVEDDWSVARLWLSRELRDEPST